MDSRSSFSYPRRSKPQRNYADYYAEDDVILSDDENTIDNDDENNTSDEDYRGHRFRHGIPSRHPRKQRKLSTINAAAAATNPSAAPTTSNYHFTPPTPAPPTWSEQATFVLLEVWGDRFLQLGRTSLRSEEWKDVAERVSQATRSKRSVSECRNRLNSLKEKYKREKAKWGLLGDSGGGNSKWVFFKKMDGLMTMSPRQLQQQELCGLACGVDSGQFVFMNPRVYLDHSNALDEMRDSPGNSESEGAADDDEDDEEEDEGSSDEDEEESGDDEVVEEESYRLLSDSIKRVGEIYEKIEDSKRQHMMELERMRVEFQRELEVQKKEMVDQTSAEIVKLGQRGSDCDAEIENVSE